MAALIHNNERQAHGGERINFDISASEFKERFRFSAAEVETILLDIGPLLRNTTEKVNGLQPHHRFITALRFYATGDFCYSVGDAHGISKASVHASVQHVTTVLVNRYFKEVISWPQGEAERRRIPTDFYQKARFPAVCGAVDGTLIPISCPTVNECQFVDRKGRHSLNVMVIAGPKYQFYCVNSNWPGSLHDARGLRESQVFRRFSDGWRPFPNAVVLGDGAYPLLNWLMTEISKPAGRLTDQERRFNFALRRTRFVVENALGILKNRFQCLKFIRVRNPKKAAMILNACVVLHNFLVLSRGEAEDGELIEPAEVDNANDIAEDEDPGNLHIQNRQRREGIARRNRILRLFEA